MLHVWRRPTSLLRLLSSRHLSLLRYILPVYLAWTVFDAFLIHHRLQLAHEASRSHGSPQKPVRVYIAALHWNSEVILRQSWNKGILRLVQTLGPKNVFVSVFESGSWDHTKETLRDLDTALGSLQVSRNITLDDTTHAEEIASPPLVPGNGWIKTSRDRLEFRRIPYLARLRNRSMQPLLDMASKGTEFDYVLFLGDVVFTVEDVMTLLNTQGGSYAAACALDFTKPPNFYDTFALRDAEGYEHATQTWPYFRSSRSRKAMTRGEPVPVTSCWNGMVAMPANTFTHNQTISFRGIDDTLATTHLEGSECCLIHTDNPASKTEGVYLNPHVRVGYNSDAYNLVNPNGLWVSRSDIFLGSWRNRLSRWCTTPWFKGMAVWMRKHKWEKQNPELQEDGMICLINEMHVLAANGWAHV